MLTAKSLFLNEKGSVIIIVAISMTALLLATALVVDIGTAEIEVAKVQNAADAAAYSAGVKLPVGENDSELQNEIINKAVECAEKNGFSGLSTDNVTFGGLKAGKYTTLTVKIPASAQLAFGGLTGRNMANVVKSATVQASAIKSIPDAVPLGVEKSAFESAVASGNTQHIVLKYSGGGGTEGFFGALDLDGLQGGGARDFSTWLAFGYGGNLNVGDILPIESGNMAGPTNTALAERLGQCTHFSGEGGCTPEHFVNDCPRVIKVIIFENVDGRSVKIDGFAAFVLETTNEFGEVIGSYSKMVLHSSEYDNNDTDFGITSLNLIG
ncbi:MAG: pilus assembly protein TadG-related protein [Bacillota bacterium]|nr:pilus assembly protein TadG-related protein [Bacillota bacterium]